MTSQDHELASMFIPTQNPLLGALWIIWIDLIAEVVHVSARDWKAQLIFLATSVAASPMPIVRIRRFGDTCNSKECIIRVAHTGLEHGARSSCIELACCTCISFGFICTVVV